MKASQMCHGNIPVLLGRGAVSFCRHKSTLPDGFNNTGLVVSILGPPNVGKSTLVNRLMCPKSNRSYKLSSDKKARKGRKFAALRRGGGTGIALVSPHPGTTRDRRECIGRIGEMTFSLVDTAGLETEFISKHKKRGNRHKNKDEFVPWTLHQELPDPSQQHQQASKMSPISSTYMKTQIVHQTAEAIRQADVVFLMFDGKVGVTADFIDTARWIQRNCNHPMNGSEYDSEPWEHDGHENTKQELQQEDGHKSTSRVVLLANKLEGDSWSYEGSPILENLQDASLRCSGGAFGQAIPISASQGEGMADISTIIHQAWQDKQQRQKQLKMGTENDDSVPSFEEYSMLEQDDNDDNGPERPLRLAILGRPNVGKSTLVNTLLREHRVLAGPTPGLTRDSITIPWKWKGRPVQLVDTAGIRKLHQHRHPKFGSLLDSNDGLEYANDLAVQDAIRALKQAEVAVLVLDAEARCLIKQELAIANSIIREGRCLVVAANKMDLLVTNPRSNRNNKRKDEYGEEDLYQEPYTATDFANAVREHLETRIPFLRKTPIVAMSSLTGEQVHDLMPVVFEARDRWSRTISTGLLNRWLREDVDPPPLQRGIPARIKYIVQTKGRPPTFLLFCNVEELPVDYLRYLVRNFQDTFEYHGMEVRMAVKKSSTTNPHHDKEANKRIGSGLGGKDARMKRKVQSLKTTGKPKRKRRRKRWQ